MVSEAYGDHAGAPVCAGHLDAIDVTQLDGGEAIDDLTDFVGRNVFRLPAEGIADTINKLIVRITKRKTDLFLGEFSDQVAGVEPCVAFLENITKDFLFGGFFVRVAFKWSFRIDVSYAKPGFASSNRNALTYFIPQNFVSIDVVFDQGNAGGRCADRAVLVE